MEEVPLRPVIDKSEGRHPRVDRYDKEARLAGDGGPDAIIFERSQASPLVGRPRPMPQPGIGPGEKPQFGNLPGLARVDLVERWREPGGHPFDPLHATASSTRR